MAEQTSEQKRELSDEHRAALKVGRAEGRTVREYLAALETQARTSGRDPDVLRERIGTVQDQIDSEPEPARRVELIQQRLNLEQQLADTADTPDLDRLETAFVDVAANYSARKGISYQAWRELGVSAKTLKAAGIRRGRS